MSDNIFSAAPEATPPAATVPPSPTPAVPVVPQELNEFVGQGKKYATVEDALKSIPHAQSHIPRLEQELAQLREELGKRKTAAELLEELKQSGFQKPVEPTAPPVAFNQDTLVQIVSNQLEQREAKRIADQNVSQVVTAFTTKFGDKAKAVEAYNKLAQDTGLPVAELDKLAARSPAAVLKLAGLVGAQTPTPVGKPASSVNTEAMRPGAPGGELSARVPQGASTKQMVAAWHAAGEKVKKNTTQ